MKLRKIMIAALLVATSSTSFAADLLNKQTDAQQALSQIKIQMEQLETHQRQIDWALAPVKTSADMQAMLTVKSPLDALSPGAKQRFVDSIVYRAGGIGGFYYGDLEAELTMTELHRILKLIGSQYLVSQFRSARIATKLDALLAKPQRPSVAVDYKDYACTGRSNCKETSKNICKAAC
jgi:hypothetical protein